MTIGEGSVKDVKTSVYQEIDKYFEEQKFEIQFNEYIQIIEKNPTCHLRDGKQFIRDALKENAYHVEGFGNKSYIRSPAFDDSEFHLIEHSRELDSLLKEIDRLADSDMRDNKIIALFGPNQIGKSTTFNAIAKAISIYSEKSENGFFGVPVFILGRTNKSLGFGKDDSKYPSEVKHFIKVSCPAKCHPLWIYPVEARRKLINKWLISSPDFKISQYVLEGQLCRSCEEHLRQKFEEKKEHYPRKDDGSIFERVLDDIKVKRIIHNRLRKEGIVFQGPEIVNDGIQVMTQQNYRPGSDRSEYAFTYTYTGPLIGAIRGILIQDEFLKKGIEYLKPYLQIVGNGEVTTPYENIPADFLTLVADNLESLETIRQQYPTFYPYFKARVKMIFMGHLLSGKEELKLYEKDIANYEKKNIRFMKYSLEAFAMFLIMCRLKKCNRNNYDRLKEKDLFDLVEKISLKDKYELYKNGIVTRDGFSEEEKRIIERNLYRIADEYKGIHGEGMFGPHFEDGRAFLDLVVTIGKDTRPVNIITYEDVIKAFDELLYNDSKYHFVRENKALAATGEFARLGFIRYDDHSIFHDPIRKKIKSYLKQDLEQSCNLLDYNEILDKWKKYLRNIQSIAMKKSQVEEFPGKFTPVNIELIREIERKRLGIYGEDDDHIGQIGESVFQHRIRLLGGILDTWVKENQGKKPEDYYRNIYKDYLNRIYDSYHKENKEWVGQLLINLKKSKSGEQKFFDKENKEIKNFINNLSEKNYSEEEMMWLINTLEADYIN